MLGADFLYLGWHSLCDLLPKDSMSQGGTGGNSPGYTSLSGHFSSYTYRK